MTGLQNFFDLQPLFFSEGPEAALFARAESGLAALAPDGRAVTLRANAVWDLNSFFGSFYESAWIETGKLDSFALSFTLKGSAHLRLYRSYTDKEAVLLLDVPLYGKGDRVEVPVPQKTDAQPSRLFARFTAREDGVCLSALAWSTRTPPRHPVHLAVVLCTMDRPQDVARLLTVWQNAQENGLAASILLVNHGAPDLAVQLAPLLQGKALQARLITQANLGGSGGFARGIVAALDMPFVTHVLLCDDDIGIDPLFPQRIANLLAYAPPDCVIGAFMLDALKPTLLHNAVARMNADLIKATPVVPHADLAAPQASDLFLHDLHGDFCGWWSAAFSRAALEKGALPLPFFLHYDDVAYGVRLKQQGFAPQLWPGLAVWHEPFYLKTSASRRYYDWRNALCLLALFGPWRKGKVLRGFWYRLFLNARRGDAASAAATLNATHDLLRAARLIPAWDAAAHRKMVVALAAYEKRRSLLFWLGALGQALFLTARLSLFKLSEKDRATLLRCTTRAYWSERFNESPIS